MEKANEYYQVLGLKPGASQEEIARAYKILTKTWYPQRNNEDQALREIAKEKLREIEEAYVRLGTSASAPLGQEGPFSGSELASGPKQPGANVSIPHKTIDEPHPSHETGLPPPNKQTRFFNSWFASEKMSVPLLVLVAVTVGVYYPIWFLQRRNALNKLRSKEKIGSGVFIFAIVTISIGFFVAILSGVVEGTGSSAGKGLANIEKILPLIVGIPMLIQCFKVRQILHEHFNSNLQVGETLSGVATFFFQLYYLQYKINSFIDEARASEHLTEGRAVEETCSPGPVRVLDTLDTPRDQEKSTLIPLLGVIAGIGILIFIVVFALKKADLPMGKGNDIGQETKVDSSPKVNRSSTDSPSDESKINRINGITEGDWRFLRRYATGKEIFYDANSLRRDPNSNRVTVWSRSLLLPEEREKPFYGPSPSKIQLLEEYDCTEVRSRILTVIYYDDDGNILSQNKEQGVWVYQPSGSSGGIDFELFCR